MVEYLDGPASGRGMEEEGGWLGFEDLMLLSGNCEVFLKSAPLSLE